MTQGMPTTSKRKPIGGHPPNETHRPHCPIRPDPWSRIVLNIDIPDRLADDIHRANQGDHATWIIELDGIIGRAQRPPEHPHLDNNQPELGDCPGCVHTYDDDEHTCGVFPIRDDC